MDKFIGHHGRQDSEFDNTLSDYAEYSPQQSRPRSTWKLVLLVLAFVPWSLIALLFARWRFMLHAH